MTLASRAAEYMLKKVTKGSDEDGVLWAELKENVEVFSELRRPFEQQWIINLAFLAGKQYTFFNSTAHLLQSLKQVPGRIRAVDNKLLPRWKRQVADWIKTEPIMSVVPQTMEEEDVQAAKVGDKIVKNFWQSNRMKQKQRALAGWVFACGEGYLDDRWNPKLGPITVSEKGDLVYGGDVDCGVWSPFELLFPEVAMGCTDLHSFPEMIKQKWRTLDYLRGMYPKGIGVVAEQMPSPVMDLGLLVGGTTARSSKVPGAMLYERYVQPCVAYPKGLFVAAANGIILEKADYPFTQYNIEQFKDIDIPGVYRGKATVTDAIGLQKTWNRTISSIEEFNRTMGKGKWLIPRGSNLEADPDDTHGQKMLYTAKLGQKPELLTLKGLPTSYSTTLEVTALAFDDLFSQHEISRGTNKSDIRSGEMVSLLREQDAHGAIPAHAIFEEALERVMSRVLKRVQKGYDNSRMVSVVGRDDEFEVFAFKGADLRNNTDVKIKKQSSLPDSRMAREARIMEKFQQGLYGDPADPATRRHVMGLVEDAPVNILFSAEKQDENVAKWENKMLLQGAGVIANPYDNHAIHMEEHVEQRKRLDYQKVKMQNPQQFMQIEVVFEEHCKIHNQFLAEQRKAMLEEQVMLGGAKGGGIARR